MAKTANDAELAERYEAGAEAYDELYGQEQLEKYRAALPLLRPRGRILDVGCGTGLLLEYMASEGLLDSVEKLVCLDVSASMLERARARASRLCPDTCLVVVGSAEALPFRDRAFDAAYSFSVINLLEDPEAAASEVARVSASSLVTLLKAFRAPNMRGWRALGEAGKDFVFTR